MESIDELVAKVPTFSGMREEHLELIAGCARNEVFERDQHLMREGKPADRFYVIRRGRVVWYYRGRDPRLELVIRTVFSQSARGAADSGPGS